MNEILEKKISQLKHIIIRYSSNLIYFRNTFDVKWTLIIDWLLVESCWLCDGVFLLLFHCIGFLLGVCQSTISLHPRVRPRRQKITDTGIRISSFFMFYIHFMQFNPKGMVERTWKYFHLLASKQNGVFQLIKLAMIKGVSLDVLWSIHQVWTFKIFSYSFHCKGNV